MPAVNKLKVVRPGRRCGACMVCNKRRVPQGPGCSKVVIVIFQFQLFKPTKTNRSTGITCAQNSLHVGMDLKKYGNMQDRDESTTRLPPTMESWWTRKTKRLPLLYLCCIYLVQLVQYNEIRDATNVG